MTNLDKKQFYGIYGQQIVCFNIDFFYFQTLTFLYELFCFLLIEYLRNHYPIVPNTFYYL